MREADYSIQYAVTFGEERYVPRHIPNVMDIGVRVADVVYHCGNRIVLQFVYEHWWMW